MPWLVTFEDEPTKVGLRTTHVDKHIAYVRSVAGSLLASGALRDTPDGKQTGGMWVIDKPTRAEAMAIFEGDPFFKEGLRANVVVKHWTKGVWEGKFAG